MGKRFSKIKNRKSKLTYIQPARLSETEDSLDFEDDFLSDFGRYSTKSEIVDTRHRVRSRHCESCPDGFLSGDRPVTINKANESKCKSQSNDEYDDSSSSTKSEAEESKEIDKGGYKNAESSEIENQERVTAQYSEEVAGYLPAVVTVQELVKDDPEIAPLTELEILQFVIISHGGVDESLRRIRKWNSLARKYDLPNISLNDAIDFYHKFDVGSWVGAGGKDWAGRRIFVVDFGKPDASELLEVFPVLVRFASLLWDACMADVESIENGVCFVGNMKTLTWKKFNMEFVKSFCNLWQDGYPIRVRRIVLVDLPLFFRGLASVVSLFIPKKISDRFKWVKGANLDKFVPLEQLPLAFGGTMEFDLEKWIRDRLAVRAAFKSIVQK